MRLTERSQVAQADGDGLKLATPVGAKPYSTEANWSQIVLPASRQIRCTFALFMIAISLTSLTSCQTAFGQDLINAFEHGQKIGFAQGQAQGQAEGQAEGRKAGYALGRKAGLNRGIRLGLKTKLQVAQLTAISGSYATGIALGGILGLLATSPLGWYGFSNFNTDKNRKILVLLLTFLVSLGLLGGVVFWGSGFFFRALIPAQNSSLHLEPSGID